jgi:hypothetical protein
VKALRKIGFSKACALGFLLMLVAAGGGLPEARSSANPVNPWNSHAIESALAGVQVREIDSSKSEVVFLYDLDNKTDSDYQLSKGPSVVIMSRLKSSGSLSSEKQISLASGAFVPARNRTRIEVFITRPFNWPARMDVTSQSRIRQLVTNEIAGLEGFVLFDQETRYQIDLPGSWAEAETAP